eukprot:4178013-Prymnesium_polylepis.1
MMTLPLTSRMNTADAVIPARPDGAPPSPCAEGQRARRAFAPVARGGGLRRRGASLHAPQCACGKRALGTGRARQPRWRRLWCAPCDDRRRARADLFA